MAKPEHPDAPVLRARLTEAFKGLRKAGYFARANLEDCMTNAMAAVPEGVYGHVFYHRQDAARIRQFGNTYLAWSGNLAEIVQHLRDAGLHVEQGSVDERIVVSASPPQRSNNEVRGPDGSDEGPKAPERVITCGIDRALNPVWSIRDMLALEPLYVDETWSNFEDVFDVSGMVVWDDDLTEATAREFNMVSKTYYRGRYEDWGTYDLNVIFAANHPLAIYLGCPEKHAAEETILLDLPLMSRVMASYFERLLAKTMASQVATPLNTIIPPLDGEVFDIVDGKLVGHVARLNKGQWLEKARRMLGERTNHDRKAVHMMAERLSVSQDIDWSAERAAVGLDHPVSNSDLYEYLGTLSAKAKAT